MVNRFYSVARCLNRGYLSSFPAEVMVFITMSEFRDPPEERLGFAVCLKVGKVDVLEVAVCLKVGKVDVLEGFDALLRPAFFFDLFVGSS